jgi:glucose/arabinose dehydrogenase
LERDVNFGTGMFVRRIASITAALLCMSSVAALQKRSPSVEIVGHVVKPEQLSAGAAEAFKVLAGFSVTVFAEGLGKPRMLEVAADGSVYVTRREPGDVVVLRDTNGDGRADDLCTAVRRPMLHGIAIAGRRHLVSVNDVFKAHIASDGTFENVTRIVDDLPEGGEHANRTIRIGPNQQLYVSVGSTCNACDETSPENATLLRISPDGKSRRIFSSGLRDTIGFGWHPDTGELFGMGHGIDWLGDDDQPEELNHLQRDKQYGWPYVHAEAIRAPVAL